MNQTIFIMSSSHNVNIEGYLKSGVHVIRTMVVWIVAVCLIMISCKSGVKKGYELKTDQMDSISSWVIYSKDASLPIEERKDFLIKAFNLSLDIKIDSLRTRALLKVSFRKSPNDNIAATDK